MTQTSIGVGVVGIGKTATDQHLPVIAGSDAFRLVAAASRHGAAPGVTTHPSVEAMLEAEPAVEAVALCTPPQVRTAQAVAALRADRGRARLRHRRRRSRARGV